jgi:Terminase RNaseH-like domain
VDGVDVARAQLSERDYMHEYLEQFLETDGSVFTNVLSCVVDALPQTRQFGHEYLLGVDWGRLQDATACVVLDLTA